MQPGAVQRGDALLQEVLSGANDDAANDLLKEFFSGYPIDRLRLLLRSDADDPARAGAWIASELGDRAHLLLDEFPALLHHPLKYVRFFAVDAVLAAATPRDGEVIAKAVALIQDAEEAVRWKVLRLLSRASKAQLEAALPYVSVGEVGACLHWLLTAGDALPEVTSRLERGQLDRLFAVAAAARLTNGREVALRCAASSTDSDISTFARDELETSAR
jgi:hypothetical protein